MAQLETLLKEAEAFCKVRGIDLKGLVATPPALRLAALQTALEALIGNEDDKKAYLLLSGQVARTRDFVLLSLLTGARKGNVLAMQWCDLNTEQGYWRIPDTKNDEPLTVPLVPEAVAILQARRAQQPANNPWVFPGTGRTGHLTSPKGAWKSVLKQAGLENLRIHDLRRSLGSWQARLGANLAVIGKSLGHKDLASTLIYSRLDLDPVRESVERATSAMFSAAGVKPLAEVVSIQEAKKPA